MAAGAGAAGPARSPLLALPSLKREKQGAAARLLKSWQMGRGLRGRTSHAARAGTHLPVVDTVLSFSLPEQERGFSHFQLDDLVLVIPRMGAKFAAADWPPEERPYRSLILDTTSEQAVSAGFPKFGNYGEFADDTAALEAALAGEEEVWFTAKMDGSLAIRSVIAGEVVFRTRGTFDGGPHGPAMRAVAAARYPLLLDPQFEPERSLLFEFVSPDFWIVLPYPEDDLILLGAIEHASLRQADLPELKELATVNGLHLIETYTLPREPTELLATINAWRGKEGIVARCASGQVLVKIKAAQYLQLHRLRFGLTARVVREICLEIDIQQESDFERYLAEQGGDWEIAQEARPLVAIFLHARARAHFRFESLKTEIPGRIEAVGGSKKRFALEFALALPAAEKAAAFSLFDGEPEQAYRGLERAALNEDFLAAETADAEAERLVDPGDE